MAPVLRRGARAVRNAGVGLAVVVVVAVLQAGEGTDRVGVGRTLSRFAVARDLTGLGGRRAERDGRGETDNWQQDGASAHWMNPFAVQHERPQKLGMRGPAVIAHLV